MAGYNGMNPGLVAQLQALIAAAAGAGHQVTITSGHRDPGKQQQLWEEALRKYGDPEIADNWVARPGTSNHEKGLAADLGFGNRAAREWVHAHAGGFGLGFPMSWEPWHIELTGQHSRSPRGAYTTPPPGHAHPADAPAEDPHDPDVQIRRLIGMWTGAMAGPSMAGGSTMSGPGMASPSQEVEALASAVTTGEAGQAAGDPNADPNEQSLRDQGGLG